jgi:hypothetical protein
VCVAHLRSKIFVVRNEHHAVSSRVAATAVGKVAEAALDPVICPLLHSGIGHFDAFCTESLEDSRAWMNAIVGFEVTNKLKRDLRNSGSAWKKKSEPNISKMKAENNLDNKLSVHHVPFRHQHLVSEVNYSWQA